MANEFSSHYRTDESKSRIFFYPLKCLILAYLVGVSFPFCVLLAFELLADAVDGDADADTDTVGVTDAVDAAAAAAAALLRDVIGEMTADLPPDLIVLLR